MIKKNTSVKRNFHNIIGGEWLVAENNATESIINLVPEFPTPSPYRGNFQAVQTGTNELNVINTAHAEEDSNEAAQSAGELLLRWTKITKVSGEEDKYIAQPKEKTVTVPPMQSCAAADSGWLYISMIRRYDQKGVISFQDETLGDVQLDFMLNYSSKLPSDNSVISVLPIASVIFNDQKEIEEIVQQQYGPGVLWVYNSTTPFSSSSSSSDDPASSSSNDPDVPVIPDDSSSSNDPDVPVIPDDSSSSDDPDVPVIPDDSSSSVTADEIIIEVNLEYFEESTGDIMGTGVITQTSHTILSGRFTAQTTCPANGYNVQLTGSTCYDYGDGDTSTEEINWLVNILRNTTRNCWDIYHLKINEWAMYHNEKNSEFDTDFSTPVYTFPDLQSLPGYPAGTIQVEHHLIYGVSNAIPDNDLTSSLVITFIRK